MWQDIIPVLAKKNRIIAVDILGHGNSDSIGYIHTMELQAEMLKALANSLKLRKYAIIGHSLGGYIGLAFAELYPDNLRSLCLLNSTTFADNKERLANRERAINLVKKNKDVFIKMAIPNLFAESSRNEFKKEIENIKQEALKTNQQGILNTIEGMKIRKDRTEILKKGRFKKILIIGQKDSLLNIQKIKETFKNDVIKLKILSNGHMSHLENKKELITFLSSF